MDNYFAKFSSAPLSDADRDKLQSQKDTLVQAGAFSGEPVFGTGGMRAITGLGTNRLNLYNVARLNLALAAYYKRKKETPLCAMAYDSRLTSPEFSRLSYHILTRAGVRVKIFKRPTPTPFLSFAVRELKADCGVVLTASHNPPQYNGYKAYGADGGQIISPVDKEIQQLFLDVEYSSLPKGLHVLASTPIPADDLIEEKIYAAYMARLTREAFYQKREKKKCIWYTPLHGTGGWLFEKAFHDLGYTSFHVLAEQKEPDGNFPTVVSPNPEEPAAFERILAAAKNAAPDNAPDLLVATDPDADRVGAMVRTQTGAYQFLTGNQIGSLLLESIARRGKASAKSPFICKTIVTTELQRLIAESYGIGTVETLTGFKYIAEQIAKDEDNYLFGGEESFGYLPISWLRDKDSLSSALALAELAEDTDLSQALDSIYLRHGLFHELLHNINLTSNPNLLPAVMAKLEKASEFIAHVDLGRAVVDVLDLRKGASEPKTQAARALKKTLGTADVIQFWLKDSSRLTIRPSGTEPKVKIYLSLMGKEKPTASSLAATKEALKNEAEQMLKKFCSALGV
ncbi:MAG TPA: phospho-sugar mutase [Turneriella sp.]|nr:phospho-sugar mutase [Turneriella sp.]